MRHPASVPILFAFALLLLPAAMAAQTDGTAQVVSRPAGCRGTNSESSSITGVGPGGQPVEFPSYTRVVEVYEGSPAQRAGMRAGDFVILQDGRDLVGNPPTEPSFAGDTVQLVVRRGDAEVPLTLVLGRWDPPQGETRTCVPVEPASSRG
jgi:hypothetical protein